MVSTCDIWDIPSDFHISGIGGSMWLTFWMCSPCGQALNLALSYYPVARECLLAVVDTKQKGWVAETFPTTIGCQFERLKRSNLFPDEIFIDDGVTAVFCIHQPAFLPISSFT